jgi:hypothetical protein
VNDRVEVPEISILVKKMRNAGQVFGGLMDNPRSFQTKALKEGGDSLWFESTRGRTSGSNVFAVRVGALNYQSPRAGQTHMVARDRQTCLHVVTARWKKKCGSSHPQLRGSGPWREPGGKEARAKSKSSQGRNELANQVGKI